MKLTINLSDRVFEAYYSYTPDNVAKAIESQLTRFKDLPPHERVLTLNKASRQKLEELLSAQINQPSDLVDSIRQALTLKVGDLQIPVTAETIQRLQEQAEFDGQDVKTFLEQKIHEGIYFATFGVLPV